MKLCLSEEGEVIMNIMNGIYYHNIFMLNVREYIWRVGWNHIENHEIKSRHLSTNRTVDYISLLYTLLVLIFGSKF